MPKIILKGTNAMYKVHDQATGCNQTEVSNGKKYPVGLV